MFHRRILVGAVLGAAAIAAVPSAANAAASCTYDAAKRQMDVRYGAADTRVTVRNGAGLQYREGTGGPFRECFSVGGVRASAANTNKVVIKGFDSSTAPLAQTTVIDESQGSFTESNPNLQFFVFTGTGRDTLLVNETSGLDQVKALDQTGGLAIGPAVDLAADGDIDVRMTTGFDSIVQIEGNGTSDLLDASGLSVAQAVLHGGGGNDTLKGGKLRDAFDGGPGNDTIFAKDGVLEDVVGGQDNDTATMDFNLDRPNSIENQKF